MSSMADAAAHRELKARVATLEAQVADLTRRMDDQSKSQRLLADDVNKTLSLKRG